MDHGHFKREGKVTIFWGEDTLNSDLQCVRLR